MSEEVTGQPPTRLDRGPGRPLTPQLRIDPLSGLKVVLAPERAARPASFEPTKPHDRSREECPLCVGRESMTPPESYAVRPDGGPADSPGWLVRAVPNKYPVLAAESSDGDVSDPLAHGRGDPELHAVGPAQGPHEVIVHSPDHVASLARLGPEQLDRAIDAWRARLAAHSSAAYLHLIVNEGPAAGASLEHTHSQLYGLPFVPAAVARERERFTAHNTRTMGGCLLCDLLQEEVKVRERVVAVDAHAVLIAPFASRLPFELQLVPRRHSLSLVEDDGSYSAILLEGLGKLEQVLGGLPPLNLWLRTAPSGAEHFHWRIDIVPRLTVLAGLELGAGVAVNIYPPERAAAELRDA
jgi:UDPglucose--hexose-1-phosphate uridylyltransferase